MKKINKLVRDRIPEIIMKKGETPIVKILDDEQYLIELNKKLKEEVNEYIADESIEELADITEVIYALVEAKGKTIEEFEKIRLDKRENRGAFKDKVYLEYTK